MIPGVQALCHWEWLRVRCSNSLPVEIIWALISPVSKATEVPWLSCQYTHLFSGSAVNKEGPCSQQTPPIFMGRNEDLYHSKPGRSAWCPNLSPKSLPTWGENLQASIGEGRENCNNQTEDVLGMLAWVQFVPQWGGWEYGSLGPLNPHSLPGPALFYAFTETQSKAWGGSVSTPTPSTPSIGPLTRCLVPGLAH